MILERTHLKPLVVTEYPKSGGTWLTSMLGTLFNWPCRDIYVREGFSQFDISKHPWYRDASALDFPERCVVKSHELPESGLIDFDATFIHLYRDGRDVTVSKYFFEKQFLVRNEIVASFEKSFPDFVSATAAEWAAYVRSWTKGNAIQVAYEALLRDTATTLARVVSEIPGAAASRDEIAGAVAANTKARLSASLADTFKHNTFVRKGVEGDWRNYFSDEDTRVFESLAGAELTVLGYSLQARG